MFAWGAAAAAADDDDAVERGRDGRERGGMAAWGLRRKGTWRHLEVLAEPGEELHLDVHLAAPRPPLCLKLKEALVLPYCKVEVPRLWGFPGGGGGAQGGKERRGGGAPRDSVSLQQRLVEEEVYRSGDGGAL